MTKEQKRKKIFKYTMLIENTGLNLPKSSCILLIRVILKIEIPQ